MVMIKSRICTVESEKLFLFKEFKKRNSQFQKKKIKTGTLILNLTSEKVFL